MQSAAGRSDGGGRGGVPSGAGGRRTAGGRDPAAPRARAPHTLPRPARPHRPLPLRHRVRTVGDRDLVLEPVPARVRQVRNVRAGPSRVDPLVFNLNLNISLFFQVTEIIPVRVLFEIREESRRPGAARGQVSVAPPPRHRDLSAGRPLRVRGGRQREQALLPKPVPACQALSRPQDSLLRRGAFFVLCAD